MTLIEALDNELRRLHNHLDTPSVGLSETERDRVLKMIEDLQTTFQTRYFVPHGSKVEDL